MSFLRIISGGNENLNYEVSSLEILNVSTIDLVSDIVYYSAFTFFLILFKNNDHKKKILPLTSQVYILLSFSILATLNLLLPRFFLKNFWIVGSALSSIGPICAIIILILGIKYNNKLWVLLGSVPLIIIILLTLISGLRGAIVGISICFIILAIIELHKKQIKRIFIIAIIPLVILSLIQENLNSLKYAFVVAAANKTVDFTTIGGYVDFMSAYLSGDSSIKKMDSESSSILQEIEFRYGAPTLFGVGFIRMADRGEYAYFNPILNSFYSFLPRQIINSEKPFPGSADGTEKTMGMYACYNEITGYDHNMTDFSVGSHYYWELSWLGVIFLSIIPAFYNVVIINLSKRWAYVGGAILVLSFKPFWLLSKLWISEIIIMLPTVMLPVFALVVFFKYGISVCKALWQFQPLKINKTNK